MMALGYRLLALAIAALPVAGLAQVWAEPQAPSRAMPEDAGECSGKSLDWLKRSSARFAQEAKPYTDLKKMASEHPRLVYLDFDRSIYWNEDAIDLGALGKKAQEAQGKPITVAWNWVTSRRQVYLALWALNDAGITPTVVLFNDLTGSC
jgi:hypothetical protein